MSDKKRVDVALVERGLAQSREKAQALVMSGVVYIGENKVDKASAQVMPEDELIVRQTGTGYVSRGARRLALRPKIVWRWIWARLRADLRMCCCKTARRMCTPSMWDTASWIGNCAMIRVSR